MHTTVLYALLFPQLLAAGWTTRVGDGCYHWPPREDPSLSWHRCLKEPNREDAQGCREPCHPPNGGSREGSPLQHQRCPRVALLQASFATLLRTTLPANDKPVPDWAAFCSFIAILVSITLGLVAWHCKERYWGRRRACCCTHVFLSESPDSTPQMEDLSSSLLIPLPLIMTPYIGNLTHRGVSADDLEENLEGPPVIHLLSVGAENPEDKAIGGSVGSRTIPGHALKLRSLPDHILEPRPPLENALEPRPSPGHALEPRPSPDHALEPRPSPGHALEPRPSPGHALEPRPSPGHALEPRASPDHALEPRASPDHALEPRPSPDHALEPRPSPDRALEPRPSPDHAPGLILKTEPISTPATPGEEKLLM
nr:mucin-1-like [Pogona vitticeps]